MSPGADGTPQYIRGVPHALPEGEHILWQGAPEAMPIAKHVFHWRLLVAYFAVMTVVWAASTALAFNSQEFLVALLVRVGLSALVLAIVFVMAGVVARTSWYAITSQRLVLRLGMVFEMSINVPFTILDSAGVGVFKDGTGQVVLTLTKPNRLAYIALWPHCRVFSINHPQPVLRGLRDPQRIGTLLAQAVADASEGATRAPSDSARATASDPHLAPQPV
ncbi:photosynthetic complex putative assembly protein PuhB [Gemmatimonas sp.]|uniref:photosynthetic complex putative assembly protein PuhB n=1 Tax=Gemmatimonas sp. TaxID=1962908 RepID=UPI00286A5683|nr:photosynthetic complex putative assembly protein PuhB [Gemmatimonas sp.]